MIINVHLVCHQRPKNKKNDVTNTEKLIFCPKKREMILKLRSKIKAYCQYDH